jgi:hypothetical protein
MPDNWAILVMDMAEAQAFVHFISVLLSTVHTFQCETSSAVTITLCKLDIIDVRGLYIQCIHVDSDVCGVLRSKHRNDYK